MIINSIKRFAAKKKIAQLAEERTSQKFSFPIKTLGIIIDDQHKDALKELLKLKEFYKIPESGLKVFIGSGSKGKQVTPASVNFSLKDFNNKAQIINEDLQQLSSHGFDLLITFAEENNRAAHLLTAYTNAKMKIGRYQQNLVLYDLIMQTGDNAPLFVEELVKYLKQFQKKH